MDLGIFEKLKQIILNFKRNLMSNNDQHIINRKSLSFKNEIIEQ